MTSFPSGVCEVHFARLATEIVPPEQRLTLPGRLTWAALAAATSVACVSAIVRASQ